MKVGIEEAMRRTRRVMKMVRGERNRLIDFDIGFWESLVVGGGRIGSSEAIGLRLWMFNVQYLYLHTMVERF